MLDLTGPVVSLGVRDDGRGFESGGVPAGHLGLAIMRERGEGVVVTVESWFNSETPVSPEREPIASARIVVDGSRASGRRR